MKKIIILPLGFILVHSLYLGCCKCIEGSFFRELTSIRTVHNGLSTTFNVDTAFVKDTLFANCQLNYNLIAKAAPNPFNQLVNAAYATSCHCGGYDDKGYKYKLDSLVIKSDKPFNGAAAGANLVPFFKGMLSAPCIATNGNPATYVPVAQMFDTLAACKQYSNLNLICITPPGQEKIHNFKYILYSNGKSFEATVKRTVQWQ